VVDGRGFKHAGLREWLLIGRLPVRQRDAGHADLQGGDFRPGALGGPRRRTYEEALRAANDHEYGNGVAIFTRDGDAARDFASRVQVGMVGINVPIPVPLAYYTFGGWKRSGFGDLNQHGPDAFRFYTQDQDSHRALARPASRTAPNFVIPTMG